MHPHDSVSLSDMLRRDLLAYGREIGAPVRQRMTKPVLVRTLEAHLAEHGQDPQRHGSPPVRSGGAQRRVKGGAPRPAQPASGRLPASLSEPERVQQSPTPTAAPAQDSPPSLGGRLKALVGAVGGLSTIAFAGAYFVDRSFLRSFGADGQLRQESEALVYRALPLLVVALAVTAVLLVLLMSLVGWWQRRHDDARDQTAHAGWIATAGAAGFLIAFLATTAFKPVANATKHVKVGEEVPAVRAPVVGWELYRSDVYYVQRVTLKDPAKQQRFAQRYDPERPLPLMYLKSDNDAQDKQILLYDYVMKEPMVVEVAELCAGSTGTPALSIDCGFA